MKYLEHRLFITVVASIVAATSLSAFATAPKWGTINFYNAGGDAVAQVSNDQGNTWNAIPMSSDSLPLSTSTGSFLVEFNKGTNSEALFSCQLSSLATYTYSQGGKLVTDVVVDHNVNLYQDNAYGSKNTLSLISNSIPNPMLHGGVCTQEEAKK